MTKGEIRKFYRDYKDQILLEMREYMDKPLENIDKISDYEYIAYENDIYVKYLFINRFGGDLLNLPKNVDKKLVQNYWEISWSFINNSNKLPQAFLRVSGTSLQIINQFINNKNPLIISFSGLTKGHDSIYKGSFKNKIKNLFGEQYSYIVDEEDNIFSYYLVNKSVLKNNDAINNRANETSINESLIYWRFPHLHPSTPTNIKIKNKIKNKIITNIYI